MEMVSKKVLVATVSISLASAEAELIRLRSENPGLVVQMVSVRRLPSPRSVQMIAEQTLRALRTGALLAGKPEVDLLLRLAGTNQIADAMRAHGYRASGLKVLVAAGPSAKLVRMQESLAGDERYRVLEGGELDADGLMMVERAALLGTRKTTKLTR